MSKKAVAMVLTVVLVFSLCGATALADGETPPMQTDPAQVVSDEQTPQQDTQTPADPEGTLSYENLEQRVRAGDLKILILEENIARAESVDFTQLKEELRDQLNTIADKQWSLITAGGSFGSPEISFSPEFMANPDNQKLLGVIGAMQQGMSALTSLATSSARQSLDQAYATAREQFDALQDGETQKSIADGVRQMRDMQNAEVMLAQATYIQLVELNAALNTLDRSLAAMDRQIEELELRYELGQISALTLKQVKTARSSLASQRESYALTARTGLMGLEFMIGAGPTGTTKLTALPLVTKEQLAAMDLEKDLEAAQQASYSLYSAKKTLDDAEQTFKDAQKEYGEREYQYTQAQHTWQADQYTYEATIKGFEISFRTLYAQVKDYAQVLDAAQTALAVEQESYAAEQLKYEQGNLSHNKLLDAADTLAAAQDKVDTAQRNLFSAYNNYRWAVDCGILN
ncbi:TolC family protein [Feifania hominis]|uniref:TolC family protein n=1 Tax=Feifania hominis TaxID=2763660 RepID=A0A926HTG0_9FIRM|nr:TolC family protein [Feifania hominis]MBC8535834.1 TolC family protein [Feifania hominis]